jgi:hypothetical protein
MNQREENMTLFTPFWPLFLMVVSLAVFLGWQVTLSVQQYIASLRMQDQQAALTEQAAQAETKLQTMMMDLLELAKNDPEARAIVGRYNIKFNPPAQSANLPLAAILPQAKQNKNVEITPPPEGKPGAAESGDTQ